MGDYTNLRAFIPGKVAATLGNIYPHLEKFCLQ